jgi:hypothetical protein
VAGGTVAEGGNAFGNPGKRFVSPAMPFVRKRFVPVKRFVLPKLFGAAGFVPTIGVCGKSGARSLNCPLFGAWANAPAPASKVKSVSRIFMSRFEHWPYREEKLNEVSPDFQRGASPLCGVHGAGAARWHFAKKKAALLAPPWLLKILSVTSPAPP